MPHSPEQQRALEAAIADLECDGAEPVQPPERSPRLESLRRAATISGQQRALRFAIRDMECDGAEPMQRSTVDLGDE